MCKNEHRLTQTTLYIKEAEENVPGTWKKLLSEASDMYYTARITPNP